MVYADDSIVGRVKSERLGWTGRMAAMGEIRNV
jgi:hypothetical protein